MTTKLATNTTQQGLEHLEIENVFLRNQLNDWSNVVIAYSFNGTVDNFDYENCLSI